MMNLDRIICGDQQITSMDFATDFIMIHKDMVIFPGTNASLMILKNIRYLKVTRLLGTVDLVCDTDDSCRVP